jgi:hypothetical protein
MNVLMKQAHWTQSHVLPRVYRGRIEAWLKALSWWNSIQCVVTVDLGLNGQFLMPHVAV